MATELERGPNAGRPGESFLLSPPTVSLPKGGGAIRGIGEKFAANPVTGTGSMTVPIATSPGAVRLRPAARRSPTTPARATARSASAGACRCPRSPARPTRACRSTATPRSPTSSSCPAPRTWCRCSQTPDMGDARRSRGSRTIGAGATAIRRYRPRIEGLFARIERWSRLGAPGDVHWRSISKDNVLTLYGKRRELAHRRSGRSEPHLHLADLRDARRQGQRRPLRVQARRTASASISTQRARAQPRRRGTTPAARPTATSSASATATARRCLTRTLASARDS